MKNPTVFVDYPAEFFSMSKLARKLDKLLCNIAVFDIVALRDANDLLMEYCSNVGASLYFLESLQEAKNKASHAVFFVDSKKVTDLPCFFSEKMSVKVVKLDLAKVVNKDKGEEYDIYIGRGTVWGNPYAIGPDGDRDEVVRKFEYDFERRLHRFFENNGKDLDFLKGKVLGCHCKPAACHGDVLVKYLNSLDDGK